MVSYIATGCDYIIIINNKIFIDLYHAYMCIDVYMYVTVCLCDDLASTTQKFYKSDSL